MQMNRRSFLSAVAGSGMAAAFPHNTSSASVDREKRPNIVIIYADDMGWGDVGYHGYKDIKTPNIDALAAGGVQFSQGYVSASVCGPSRVGLLTGVYQQRLGVYGNFAPKHGLTPDQPLLFEMLKEQAYTCGVVGKWHLGMEDSSATPNQRGVDHFYGFLFGAHDYHRSRTNPKHKKMNQLPIYRNTEIQPPIQDSNGYLTDMLTDEAVRFLEHTGDRPFCLYLAYNAVHSPWQVPDSYVDRLKDLPADEERRHFAGMVLALDDGVGRVIETLRKKGVLNNTIVFFISDNGTPRGQGIKKPTKDQRKDRGGTTMSNPGPFRGFKGDTYEGGTRVPFIVHWPGHIPAGVTYRHPVINLDVVPTVMALLGVDAPTKGLKFDGVNLLPYLTGKKGANQRPHDVLYWRRGNDYAIRDGDWKLAWNDQGRSQRITLFDLAADPGEYRDLSGKHPERGQQLQDRFDAWDCRLPNNRTGRNPQNRNHDYPKGNRMNVREFNANPPTPPIRRGRKPARH